MDIPSQLTHLLRPAGLDIVHAFDVAAYDALARDHARLSPLAAPGREHALAVLIGNTRALWEPFIESYGADASVRDAAEPLDSWVAAKIGAAVGSVGVAVRVHLATEGGARLVSMLHAARASGLARVGPAHLAVHPTYGPWFALRAVVVFDAPPPKALDQGSASTPPCDGCAAPCRAAMEHALASATEPPGRGRAEWRLWLAVRDACPVGTAWRYDDAQLCYHYTKDRSVLVEAR